jgi:hypothetical protein
MRGKRYGRFAGSSDRRGDAVRYGPGAPPTTLGTFRSGPALALAQAFAADALTFGQRAGSRAHPVRRPDFFRCPFSCGIPTPLNHLGRRPASLFAASLLWLGGPNRDNSSIYSTG